MLHIIIYIKKIKNKHMLGLVVIDIKLMTNLMTNFIV